MFDLYREIYPQQEYESPYERDLKNASHFFEGILEHLYGNKPLDKENLAHCVEELCEILGNRCPENNLTINRESHEVL